MTAELFPPLPREIRRALDGIPSLIDKTFPLPSRFRAGLPHDVADLSRLLSAARGERGISYLGKPGPLSAYLRYFLPWNLFRLCKLLPALSLSLREEDAVTDLGAGPLTLTAALWICRPDLRHIPLEFRCVDRTGAVLDAGKRFFAALAGTGPWTIRTVRGSAGVPLRGKRAALVTAVNVFNEMYWDIPHNNADGLRRAAQTYARLLAGLVREDGAVLVVEPGVPRAGEFIAALRDALMEKGLAPRAPCTHRGSCPCTGGKTRWCHFAFDTGEASAELQRLSAAAGIPKERAALSFLYAGRAPDDATRADTFSDAASGSPAPDAIRIISDPFRVGNGLGRYGCSAKGLILVRDISGEVSRGGKSPLEKAANGSLIFAAPSGEHDPKSGAPVAYLRPERI